MSKSKLTNFILTLALLLPSVAFAQLDYLVNDTFTDTDRIGGVDGVAATSTTAPEIGVPTATNTQWVVNDVNAGKLVASATGLAWTLKSSNSMVIGYFPTVTIGTEPVTFTVHLRTGAWGATTNNLRMALLNAAPSGYRTTDGFGSTDAAFVNDTGYGIFSSGSHVGGGDTTNLVLNTYERIGTNNDLLNSSGGWGSGATTSPLASSSGATGYLEANTDYILKFVLSYDGTTLSLTATVTGGNLTGLSYTATDADNPTLSFDAFTMRFGGGSNQFSDINFTSFTVTKPAAVVAPTITTAPASQTVSAGQNVTLDVTADGTTPLTYQWNKDGAALSDGGTVSGATTATLTLTGAQLSDAGSYTVTVTNSAGSVDSAAAVLVVQAATAVPTATAPTAVTSDGFTANWEAVTGATGYRLDVSTESAFGTFVTGYQDLDVGSALSQGVTGLTGATTYYYRVRASNGGGTSASSNGVGVATPAAAPLPVLHDQFAATAANAGLATDGNGFLVPTSTQAVWASFGTANFAYVQDGSLGLSAGGTRGIMAYFEPSTSLASLTIGETLTASVTFNFSGGSPSETAGNFRIGLLNSGGNGTKFNLGALSARYASGVSNSLTGTPTGNTARGYTGYIVDTKAASASSTDSLSFWFRTPSTTDVGGSTQILGPTGGADLPEGSTFSQIGAAGGGTVGAVAADGTSYMLDLSITYVSATQVDLAYTVKSGGVTVASYAVSQTAGSLVTSFDSLMIYSVYGPALQISDLKIIKGVMAPPQVAPSIETGPAAHSVAVGASTTLTVAASGTAPLNYQWQKAGVNLQDGGSYSGVHTPTLTLTGAQLADTGDYQVVVFNSVSSVTSPAATLTVTTAALPPVITSPPSPLSVAAGSNANFTVVASGTAPLLYQWNKDGTAMIDGGAVAGATTATLTLTGVQAADAGSYTVTVSNSVDTVTSNAATLTVTIPPPAIAIQPVSQSALTGTRVTFSVLATGAGPITYAWTKDGTPLAGATGAALTLVNLQASDAGSYAVIATNASGDTPSAAAVLTLVAPAAVTPPALPTIPAGTFDVTAYGAVGDGTTDNTAAIQTAIQAAVGAGGGTVEIPAAAGAYLSGPIALASNVNLQVDGGATLRALPRSSYPNSGSSPAHFITANNATNVAITGGGTIEGDGSAWWAAFNNNSNTPRPRLIQFTRTSKVLISAVTLQNAPQFHLAFSSPNNDITIFGVTIGAPSSSPNTDGIDPAGANILIQNCAISVGDDNIAVKPGSVACTNITIADCAFGTGHGLSVGGQTNVGLDGLTVLRCTFNGTTSGLRLKADATQGGPVQNVLYSDLTMTNVQYPIVFYSYYNQVGNPGAISGSNQTTPAKVASYNATPPDSLAASTIPTWKNITIRNVAVTGATGYSTIWGLPLASALIADVTLDNVTMVGGPGFEIYNATNIQFIGTTNVGALTTANALILTGQPLSQAVNPGDPVTLTVTAAGASIVTNTVPTYQWARNGVPLTNGAQLNGTVVSGATTATLTLSTAQGADAGDYTCTVSNTLDGYDVSAGAQVANSLPVSVTSSAATLTVTGAALPVSITTQPQSQTVNAGDTATLAVAAISDTSIGYQWRKGSDLLADGGRISGATTATLTLTGVQADDAGDYTVVLTNAAGPVASAVATLTVQTPPVIATAPAAQIVLEGDNAGFTVAVTGTAPFSYQWNKDGVALADGAQVSGAATDTLTLTGVQLTDAGDYTVTIANPVGEVTSASVSLTVNPRSGPPIPPMAGGATAAGPSGFAANWAAVENATGYRLDVSIDPAFGSFVPGYQDLDVGNHLSSVVTGLTSLTPYYYRVRAYNDAGTSASSNAIAVTTAGAPMAPTITSPAGTVFTLGLESNFTVVATGSPAPTFTATGLPAWVTLNPLTGVLSGTAPSGVAGAQFLLMITAQNGTAPNAIQAFTLTVQAPPTVSTPLTISTLAGKALAGGSADGLGDAARFDHLSGVAVDSAGNIFVADTASNTLRRVTPDGTVTTLAGTAGVAGTANGTGAVARFNAPSGVAVDAFGSIYVADTLNHTIRKVSAAGAVTTFVGTAGAAGSADGSGTAARFFAPQGITVSAAVLYVADTNNHTIRRVDLATGAVTTIAGLAGHPGSADGVGSAARFDAPSDVAVDQSGNLYVADTENNTIRAISATGVVSTVAGRAGSSGAADGPGAAARFNHPSAVVVDAAYNVYVLDTDNHSIRKISSAAGAVTTIAGQPGTPGSADGVGAAARFNDPVGIAQAVTGEFYIADTNNQTLRMGVVPGLPVIQKQPQSTSVTAGATVQFFVTATGRPTPTYQWLHDGAAVAGATDSTLSVANVQLASAGKYTVVVTNSQGSVTSNEATLTVGAPPPSGGLSDGGGGGAPGLWFYLSLALLVLVRQLARRHSAQTFRTSHES